MEKDIQDIKTAYEKRGKDPSLKELYGGSYGVYMSDEREVVYETIIKKNFSNIENISLLEIGAGYGGNLPFFNRIGIPFKNMLANELLEDRAKQLRKDFPPVQVIEGNALDIEMNKQFNIVFQSTVFTSILSDAFRKELAVKMWQLLANGGIILWYDFVYNNPNNKNVKKVSKLEIKALFPAAKKYQFYKVTLAPPIGRRVGRLYPILNAFPFLRTHLVAVIHK